MPQGDSASLFQASGARGEARQVGLHGQTSLSKVRCFLKTFEGFEGKSGFYSYNFQGNLNTASEVLC